MKKVISLIALVLAVVMVLCACGETASTVTTVATKNTTTGTTNGNTNNTNNTTSTTNGTTGTVEKPGCAHIYQERIIKQVTTETDGEVEYTCTKCGDKYTETVPAVTSIKILAIGNSFSVDAMEHLATICRGAGIKEVILGNLYIGGCSLDTHLLNAQSGATAYTYYYNVDGEWKQKSASLEDGLIDQDWDYITVQQVSQLSGMVETFKDLQALLDYINKTHLSNDPKIYWHMTWAYQQNSSHSGFVNYNKDQTTMYNAITNAVETSILTYSDIDGFIPAGTAIQNLRTSYMGDTLTRDGYHLSYDVGRYTAALMWFKTLTGLDITDLAVVPSEYPNIMEHLPAIKEAVNNAHANPFSVTQSEITEYVNELLVMTDADKAYLTDLGLDPSKYEVLDLGLNFSAYWNSSSTKVTLTTTAANSRQFLCTKIFTPQTLPVGSVVHIADGYQYRPEGWVKFGTANSSDIRPANATKDFIVNESFYATFPFRAFNITHVAVDGVTADISYDDRTALRIYVPKTEEPSNAMTDEDKAYLTNIGLNPDNYEKVKLDYTLYSYYNSTSTTTSTLICLESGSTANNLHNFISTRIIAKSEIPVGSVIRIDAGYQYRPERFVTLGAKPDARGTNTTTAYVIVDEAWWGTHNYVGFNVAVEGNGATVSMATGDEFVIYALKKGAEAETPKVEIDSKVADEVFAGLGYDINKYTKVEITPVLHEYYLSTSKGTVLQNSGNGTAANYTYFWATQIFSKEDLPEGTVLVIGKGYQYRPEGWQALNANNTSARPNNYVYSAGQAVEIDEAWWGNFNYRAFNVAYEGNNTDVSAEDYVVFAIYVPKPEPTTDEEWFAYNGLDMSKYELLEVEMKTAAYYQSTANTAMTTGTTDFIKGYMCTPDFLTKEDLPVGTVIFVDEGYQYRPEGWQTLDNKNTAARPDNVTTHCVVVNEAWWGNFNYRAFNLSKVAGGAMAAEDSANLRIYVPKA